MKVIKNTTDSSSFLVADEDYAQIASGPNSVSVTNDSGVYINGPLSLTAQVDNIKIGGIYKLNPLLSSCLPSTLITPIPTLVMDLPVKNLAATVGIAGLIASIL